MDRIQGGYGRAQGGFVLITCVLVMVVMALMALSMFRSLGVQEHIAGVTRDKAVALNAAITAEEYAEWWLLQPVALNTQFTACTTGSAVAVTSLSSPIICDANHPLANPGSLPWNAGNTYTPTGFTVSTSGGTNVVYQAPGFYIQYLGASTTGIVYQIDAFGYGGSQSTVAVVQATYVVTSGGCDASLVRRKTSQNGGSTC
jgi:type IV pilus assembly protein PilX